MAIFRLYADIKMNRAVDADNDYVSPETFAFFMGGKWITFDFDENAVKIDKEDASVIHIRCKNPVFYSLSNEKITSEMLSKITDMTLPIYTGEAEETDLKAIKLLNCTICLPYENWRNIKIPASVCERADMNKKL